MCGACCTLRCCLSLLLLHKQIHDFALQEVIVLHDLPSDPLAAWFYKNDEGSAEISMLGATHMGNNTGETACTFQSCSAAVH